MTATTYLPRVINPRLASEFAGLLASGAVVLAGPDQLKSGAFVIAGYCAWDLGNAALSRGLPPVAHDIVAAFAGRAFPPLANFFQHYRASLFNSVLWGVAGYGFIQLAPLGEYTLDAITGWTPTAFAISSAFAGWLYGDFQVAQEPQTARQDRAAGDDAYRQRPNFGRTQGAHTTYGSSSATANILTRRLDVPIAFDSGREFHTIQEAYEYYRDAMLRSHPELDRKVVCEQSMKLMAAQAFSNNYNPFDPNNLIPVELNDFLRIPYTHPDFPRTQDDPNPIGRILKEAAAAFL